MRSILPNRLLWTKDHPSIKSISKCQMTSLWILRTSKTSAYHLKKVNLSIRLNLSKIHRLSITGQLQLKRMRMSLVTLMIHLDSHLNSKEPYILNPKWFHQSKNNQSSNKFIEQEHSHLLLQRQIKINDHQILIL